MRFVFSVAASITLPTDVMNLPASISPAFANVASNCRASRNVPQSFELDRGVHVAIAPQQIDHLAVRADAIRLLGRRIDHAADGRHELAGIDLARVRERGEQLPRIEERSTILRA